MSQPHFHEMVLQKAAAIQGMEPPSLLPQHDESELVEAFQGSGHAKAAADRHLLLAALSELEQRGWMKLRKVMGPWAWQVTPSGIDKATYLSQQSADYEKNREK